MYEHVFESFDVDTVTYMTTVFGIIRAGYAAFPISPRNSPAAIAHLLSTKSVMHILIGGEQSLQSLARTSLNLMKESATNIPGSSPMPLFEEIYVDGKETAYDALPFKRPDMNDPGIIVHSSGKFISIMELASSPDGLLQARRPFQSPYHGLITVCYKLQPNRVPCFVDYCHQFTELTSILIYSLFGT
jgi:hypothetical protein